MEEVEEANGRMGYRTALLPLPEDKSDTFAGKPLDRQNGEIPESELRPFQQHPS
jgi:hypothetical protein